MPNTEINKELTRFAKKYRIVYAPSYKHILPALLIGESTIDHEHSELVAQLDLLLRNEDAHPNTEVFSEVLSKLGSQISNHFNYEENLMVFLGMLECELAVHIEAHTEIMHEYTELMLDFMTGTVRSRSDVLLLIKNWVIEHIECFDLNIKNYLPKTSN